MSFGSALKAESNAAQAEQRANALNREGALLGEEGSFSSAIARFQEADRIFPRPIHDCNIGLVYVFWQRLPEAWFYLQRCRGRAVKGLPAWVEKRYAAVGEELKKGDYARLDILAEPVGTVLRIEKFLDNQTIPTPTLIWLPFGEHRLELSADNHVMQVRPILLQMNQTYSLKVKLEVQEVMQPQQAIVVTPPSKEESLEPAPIESDAGFSSKNVEVIGEPKQTPALTSPGNLSSPLDQEEVGALKTQSPASAAPQEAPGFFASRGFRWFLSGLALTSGAVAGYAGYQAQKLDKDLEKRAASAEGTKASLNEAEDYMDIADGALVLGVLSGGGALVLWWSF
ncbi:MAG: hypothetical protein QGI45_15430 [Myxococcota bacterium]|nr:hypothetical protein [Myxococcota bacterium]